MDFQVQLHKIEQALCKNETEALAFLCRDIIDTDLSKVASASHLFTKLKNMDLLEAEDDFIVAELLYRIRQFYLLKIMGSSKERVEKELPQKGRISNYRQLLYDLSEDITREDLKSVKFLLQDTLPRCRLEDDMTMLKLLIEMEKEDLLDRSNLETLEKVLQIISPSLVKKISKYKNENEGGSDKIMRRRGATARDERQAQEHSCLTGCAPRFSASGTLKHKVYLEKENPLRDGNRAKPRRMAEMGILGIKSDNVCAHRDKHTCGLQLSTFSVSDALNIVFQWLGFDTVCLNDLTKNKILKEISQYQNITDHKDRDCFVCCILSHGEKGKIYGTDGRTVLISEITKPFSGKNCHHLIGKPKVFFIQACQGKEEQSSVPIEADSYTPEIEEDAMVLDSIPEDADFLVGMATVENYVSYRDTSKGTWYIQSLCQSLLDLVPRREDLLAILTKVNMAVSQKTDKLRIKKQIPQPAFSLRKKLVFPIPAERPPTLL
ncbi:caspase-8-like [Polyodon spathula]|uniref:caspase-8-like n=1 Tax=Polyodon spathula TaxID=7913 RepID=UPI001B7E228A|nr:caspase-8-like [Polyodon spathula]